VSAVGSPDVRATLESASNLVQWLENQATPAVSLNEINDRVELREDGISIALNIEVHCSRSACRPAASSIYPLSGVRLKRRGVETGIIMAEGDDLPRKLDPALLKAVARSRVWFEELASDRAGSIADIACHENLSLCRASLAPGVHSAQNRRSNLPRTSAS